MNSNDEMDVARSGRHPNYLVYRHVSHDERLNQHAKHVYFVLCDFADYQSRECYPKIKTIAKLCGKGQNQVRAGIKQLVEFGYLTQTIRIDPKTGGQTSNLYTLHDVETMPAPLAQQEPPPLPEQKGPPPTPGGLLREHI